MPTEPNFETVPWVTELRAKRALAPEEVVLLALDIRPGDSKETILGIMVSLHGPRGRADSKSLLDELDPGESYRLLVTRRPGVRIEAKVFSTATRH